MAFAIPVLAWYAISFLAGLAAAYAISMEKRSLLLYTIMLVVLFALFAWFGALGGLTALAYRYYK